MESSLRIWPACSTLTDQGHVENQDITLTLSVFFLEESGNTVGAGGVGSGPCRVSANLVTKGGSAFGQGDTVHVLVPRHECVWYALGGGPGQVGRPVRQVIGM